MTTAPGSEGNDRFGRLRIRNISPVSKRRFHGRRLASFPGSARFRGQREVHLDFFNHSKQARSLAPSILKENAPAPGVTTILVDDDRS